MTTPKNHSTTYPLTLHLISRFFTVYMFHTTKPTTSHTSHITARTSSRGCNGGPGIHTLLTVPTTTLLLLVTSSTNTHLLLLHLDSLFSFFSSSTNEEIFSIHPQALLSAALTLFVSSQLLLLNIHHVSQAPSIPHTLLLPRHPLPDIYLIAR